MGKWAETIKRMREEARHHCVSVVEDLDNDVVIVACSCEWMDLIPIVDKNDTQFAVARARAVSNKHWSEMIEKVKEK